MRGLPRLSRCWRVRRRSRAVQRPAPARPDHRSASAVRRSATAHITRTDERGRSVARSRVPRPAVARSPARTAAASSARPAAGRGSGGVQHLLHRARDPVHRLGRGGVEPSQPHDPGRRLAGASASRPGRCRGPQAVSVISRQAASVRAAASAGVRRSPAGGSAPGSATAAVTTAARAPGPPRGPPAAPSRAGCPGRSAPPPPPPATARTRLPGAAAAGSRRRRRGGRTARWRCRRRARPRRSGCPWGPRAGSTRACCPGSGWARTGSSRRPRNTARARRARHAARPRSPRSTSWCPG